MKYQSIQCLRAIAVFLVLYAHIKFAIEFSNDHFSSSFFDSASGAFGVDIFFVISGFVISLSAKS